MLGIGDSAPDFALQDQTGTTRTLDDLLSGGRLLLYFYPADFSPVCTRQACTLRDEHDRLVAEGTSIAGVSTQSRSTHARFATKFGLSFPVLADENKSVCRAYEALGPFGLWTNRVSYLIGPDRAVLDRARSGLFLKKHRHLIASS